MDAAHSACIGMAREAMPNGLAMHTVLLVVEVSVAKLMWAMVAREAVVARR